MTDEQWRDFGAPRTGESTADTRSASTEAGRIETFSFMSIRLATFASVVLALILIAASPADAGYWRKCGNSRAFSAYGIKAHGVSCKPARTLAQGYTRHKWRCRILAKDRPFRKLRCRSKPKANVPADARVQFWALF